MYICDYCHEKEGIVQFQNGKWCCEDSVNKCPNFRKNISKSKSKPIYVENSGHVCDFGCEKEAHYQFQNGNWCCQIHSSKCPTERKKKSERTKGQIKPKSIYIENSGHVCYKCNKEAHYQFQNGNWCCEDNVSKCFAIKEKIRQKNKGQIKLKLIYIENSNHVCKYCGQEAHYQFQNKEWCCEDNMNKCPTMRKKYSKNSIANFFENSNHVCKYCGREAHYQFQNGNWCCEDHYIKCPTMREKNREIKSYSIEDWKEKHPFLFKVEELRIDPITGKIQAHCKNHNCLNSKEKDGWFFPKSYQITLRIIGIERSNDGYNFYCSEHCKLTCDLFGKSAEYLMKQDLINAGHIKEEENSISGYGIWKDEVFRRNIKEYGKLTCEYCGNTNVDEMCTHHEKPIKTNPEQILDPINGWVLCKFGMGNDCHHKIGHPNGSKCSTGYLGRLICKRRYKKIEIENKYLTKGNNIR